MSTELFAGILTNIEPVTDGYRAKLYGRHHGFNLFSRAPITQETMDPIIGEIISRVDQKLEEFPGCEVEIGIYGPEDIRVWRVTRGI